MGDSKDDADEIPLTTLSGLDGLPGQQPSSVEGGNRITLMNRYAMTDSATVKGLLLPWPLKNNNKIERHIKGTQGEQLWRR